IPFGPCDFRTTETASAGDLDTFGTKTHGGLNSTLHGAAECDATFELLRNRLGNQSCVDFRLAHLDDVKVRLRVGHLRQLAAKLLDVSALLADNQAWTRRMDRDAALLVRTLNDDLGNTSLLQFLHQICTDLEILMQQPTVFGIIGKPATVPGTIDAEAEADRINFLAHYAASPSSSTSRTTIVKCANGFSIREARPRPRA